MRVLRLAAVLVVAALIGGAGPAGADEKKGAKSGSVTGVLTDKQKQFILVKADGAETARKYWKFGNRPAVNKQIDAAAVGSRVRVEWEAPGNEGPHVAKIEVLKGPDPDQPKK